MEDFLVEVTKIKYLTLTIVSLDVRLQAPEVISFTPGQDMQFLVKDQTHAYPIASPATEVTKALSFCIEVKPGSEMDVYCRGLNVGSQFQLHGPVGDFRLDTTDRNIFFVASGIGIAPFASMVPQLLLTNYPYQIKLLFGLRSEDNVFFFDHFTALSNKYANFSFTPILSRPHYHWPGEVGTINTYLEVNAFQYQEYVFYICDGKDVVTTAQAALLKLGHTPADIKTHIIP